jgi:tRNA(Ile2) C34 agmatinyltransferase TiaS
MGCLSAEPLLADLRSRGIELRVDGDRLLWRPRFLIRKVEVEQLRQHKRELMALVVKDGPRCPACGRWLDSRRRCPKCFDRMCERCGRMTTSYFIARCVLCERAL